MERLRLAAVLSADPQTVYDAWISAEEHAKMTGSNATSEPTEGGAFTAWDGYITGTHVTLERGERIVQTWRTGEFPSAAPDSTLEIRLSKVKQGTRITLLQSDIPDGQSEMYAEGWLERYFDPMTRYFESTAPKKALPEAAKSKSKSKAKSKAKAKKPAKTKRPIAAKKAKNASARKKAPAASKTRPVAGRSPKSATKRKGR